jgi:hypothetical protein
MLRFGSIPLLMDQIGLTVSSVVNSQFHQAILFSKQAREGPRAAAMEQRELYYMQENLVLNSHIRGVIYVPGLRGDQQRKWLLTEINEHGWFEGPFESYLPSLIHSWQNSKDTKRTDELKAALEILGLAFGITTVTESESEVAVLIPIIDLSQFKSAEPQGEETTELSFEVSKNQADTIESALALAMKRGAKDRGEALANIAVNFTREHRGRWTRCIYCASRPRGTHSGTPRTIGLRRTARTASPSPRNGNWHNFYCRQPIGVCAWSSRRTARFCSEEF